MHLNYTFLKNVTMQTTLYNKQLSKYIIQWSALYIIGCVRVCVGDTMLAGVRSLFVGRFV